MNCYVKLLFVTLRLLRCLKMGLERKFDVLFSVSVFLTVCRKFRVAGYVC